MSRLPQRPVTGPPSAQASPKARSPGPQAPAPGANWRQQQTFGARPRTPRQNPLAAVPLWAWITGGSVIVIVLVVALVVIPHFINVGTKLAEVGRADMRNREAMADIERTADEFERQADSLFGDGQSAAIGADFDRYVSTMEAKAARLSGTEGVITRTGINMLKQMQPEIRAYNAANQKMMATGGADPAEINSKTDIENIKKATIELRTATQKLSEISKMIPDRFRKALESENIGPDIIEENVRGFTAGMNLDFAARLHDANIKMCDVSVKVLDLLKREWGRWEFHPSENAMSFESASAEKQFFQLMDEMDLAMTHLMILEPGMSAPPR